MGKWCFSLWQWEPQCLILNSAHWPPARTEQELAASDDERVASGTCPSCQFDSDADRLRSARVELYPRPRSSCHQHKDARSNPFQPNPLSEISFKSSDICYLRIYSDMTVLYIDSMPFLFLETKKLSAAANMSLENSSTL